MKRPRMPSPSFGAPMALVAGVALSTVGAKTMPVLVDDFSARYLLSNVGAGLVATAQLAATAVAALLLGRRAAGPERVRLARGGLALAGGGCLGAAAAPGLSLSILANLVLGAGLGAVHAVVTAVLTSRSGAGRTSALAVAGSAGATALLITVVQVVNHEVGKGTGFLLMALCCLAARPLARRLPDGAVDTPREGTADPSRALLGCTALLWAVSQGAWSYTSVLGRQHAGLSQTAMSVVLTGSCVVALLGAPAGPAATRHFGRGGATAAFAVVQALALAVVVLTHDPVLFVLAAVLWQLCQLAVLAQMFAASAHLDPTGCLTAALSGVGILGAALGPLAVGGVLDLAGSDTLGVVLTLSTLAASLPLLKLAVAASGEAGGEGLPTTRAV